ncbi:MAG: Eco57I restriction-modification methylase domain-containing protein [Sandaracinobacter sp.]
MSDLTRPLLEKAFLQSELAAEYNDYIARGRDAATLTLLENWHNRTLRGEREIESEFIARFFTELWGYQGDGAGGASFSLRQQFPVQGAGPAGGIGSADLALGHFGAEGTETPQVLCEFKGVGAGLDRAQNRKGSNRSPVAQALDYLRFARRGLFDSAAVLPRFALVSDMNEFRLYWYDRAPAESLRFRIAGGNLFDGASLLSNTESDRFDRFLFQRMFRPDMLLSNYGRTNLERLLERQGTRQKKLENDFYAEYRAYRLKLYNAIKLQNLGNVTDLERLRLAQKLLDRLLFVMFSEDMGGRIAFPPNILRDELRSQSLGSFFEPEETDIWQRIKRLFRTMDEGGHISGQRIHRFNGGLFEPNPLIDRLALENHLFCTRGQGRNDATIAADKETLLYLSNTYSFAADGDAINSIGLYTLGHIFEQSLVELEALEAEAENRPSLTVITKRKRDGVYYTPEPIVRRIVEETVGPLLAGWRAEAGWPEIEDPSPEAAKAYWDRLRTITIVDPACGSGAFLITALRYLAAEFRRVLEARYRLKLDASAPDDAAIAEAILTRNLFGVDINPLSVEIAQLSLWLHTARAEQPLSSLNDTVKIGNSLVDLSLHQRHQAAPLSPEALTRIRPFDWQAEFPQVFAQGGFDAVIGNPPYVKLQHFRQPYAETAEYLRDGVNGELPYRSTQTGNFDLYLPFIERGLSLLNNGGRMGYIAPNLWPRLEYGEGLRKLVAEGRHLERWIDFRSHQVFEEATIYTAIQIYSKAPNDRILLAIRPDGDLGKVDWADEGDALPYDELAADGGEWLLAPAAVRRLIARLTQTCRRLDDPAVTSGIIVGIQTSADHIYHLDRLGRGRYLYQGKTLGGKKPAPIEVDIEDGIMKPLVSGAEAKRFIDPQVTTFLLFPYKLDENGARLWTQDEMQAQFPKAWAWLQSHSAELRARERWADARDGQRGPFDDVEWYRFGRNQSIDKQEQPKIVVPRLVPSLRLVIDAPGRLYCDNVDVGGVVPTDTARIDYLGGILGCPTVDFLFRWSSKPFRGEYLSANKQFIAPLPVPIASATDEAEVARIARALQTGYTRRLALRTALAERLGTVSRRRQPYEWLFTEVQSKTEILRTAPRLDRREQLAWVDARYETQIEAEIARLDSLIRLDSTFEATFADGELRLLIDDIPALRGIYLDADTGAFLLAQWQVVALAFEPNGNGNGKRLSDQLRMVGFEAPDALRNQIIERQQELAAISADLRELETELHEMTCRLFDLSPAERALVEGQ